MGAHSLLSQRRRNGIAAAASALALAVLGAAAIGVAVAQQQSSPEDPGGGQAVASATSHGSSVDSAPPSETTADQAETVDALDHSSPRSISIPAIDVNADVMTLGLDERGHMELPPHAPQADSETGWYKHSPAPGEFGPSIVVGHVDSAEHGPAVFHEQTALTEGDTVEIARADGTTAVFEVDRTVQYDKDDHPIDEVYANTNKPELRLITCGGDFDADAVRYDDNIVTFATLVDTRSTG